MNSNKLYQPKRSNLSREDIERYRTTQDESVKHSIEKDALENDFDSDALEGWDSLGETPLVMKRLDKRFGGTNKGFYYGIAIIGSLLLTITLLYIGRNPEKAIEQNPAVAETTSIKVEQTDIVLPEKIEAMVELPKKEQIDVKTIISDFTEQKTDEQEISQLEEVDRLPISKIEDQKKEVVLAKETIFGKELYLYDLKLLDYRAYRSRPKITTKQMILTGTPANVGENSEPVETTEWQDVEIPYIDYVDKTMELFSKGNTKKALSRFQVILETYPDDVNANFYAGLCYYNLKEYTSATNSFEKCVDSKYTNFSEEAEWYKAKSLLAGGKKNEAIELFNKISDANGYYSAQAKKIVTSL